jgi:hypothetical protein
MAKIQGFYTLRAQLYNKAATLADGGGVLYEFTDNDRNADVSSAYDCDLRFIQQDTLIADSYNGLRRFLVNNKLLIKRARLVTPGATELQPSPGEHAARLLLMSYATDGDGNETHGNAMQIKLDFFNKWQDFNVWFENFAIDSVDGTYKFKMPATTWNLNVDDYNLQGAYKNEPLYAFMELEIDTAGLISGSNQLI